jgi:cyclase
MKPKIRIIPTLLLHQRKLVKTIRFNDPAYVGDTINALRIFSEKQVDELAVIDITASSNGPDFEYLEQLVGECFMPLAYGGGIRNLSQAKRLFALGVDKVILGEAAFYNPEVIGEIATLYGSQSVVVSVDIKRDWLSRERVFVAGAKVSTKMNPVEYTKQAQERGAGEILLHSIDREGTGKGFDLDVISKCSKAVRIPVVALGGASKAEHFSQAVDAGASAVAAGSMFVYKGPHRAVLINYPDAIQQVLRH